MSFDVELLKRFPEESGVYLMKNAKGEVIYVGKAKNLKSRVKSYFSKGGDGRVMIPYLRAEIQVIDTFVLFSEKEALLLENTLIKKHKPKYNAILKDDKTFISLMINPLEKWPTLRLVRYKGKPKEKGLYFGPYTNAFAARQTYELLSKLFPLRQCSNAELARRTRPCLLYGIKRCIAPCVGLCEKAEYDTFVTAVVDFLKGKTQEILRTLYQEMQKASDLLEFEKAAAFLQAIEQVQEVVESRQSVQSPDLKDADVLGLFWHGNDAILMQLFIREGKLIGSEHYTFSSCLEEENELLESFLLQYYVSRESLPEEILLPSVLKNKVFLEEIFFETLHKKISLLTPQKGNKKTLIALAEKNAKMTFEQSKNAAELKEKLLLDLSETLHLSRFPKRIECFDTSSLGGGDLVAAMAVYTDGEYDRKRSRLYHIKTIHKADDYGALQEALRRRLIKAKEEDDLPDLLLIDGGKGQLTSALEVLKELDIANVDVAAVTKENAKHIKGMTAEKIYIQDKQEPITFQPSSPLLFLLQKIRDKAHEKAIAFHKKKRSKRLISSALEELSGIGPVKKKRLLKHFGSIKRIQEASDQQLLAIEGITKKDIVALRSLSK